MNMEELKNYVVEKLKEMLLFLDSFVGQFLGWFDKVFPPDTRKDKISHWFHIALPFLIPTVAVILVSYCCYCCCCRGRGRVKMMKAPGRNCRMLRTTFESNPGSYFKNLRTYPGDQLV